MPINIVSGGFSCQFEPETGFVRYIRYGDQELVRAIYAVVRDENWGTLRHEPISLEQSDDGIRWTHRCWNGDDAWLEFDGELTWSEGQVSYGVIGRPLREFSTARTGVCLLHPREHQGWPLVIGHPEGRVLSSHFPTQIDPEIPFTDIAQIAFSLNHRSVKIEFAGELFEMEDQRNWLDASFKTYCWPKHRGFPYPLIPTSPVDHRVVVSVSGPPEAATFPSATLKWDDCSEFDMPQLGTVIRGAVPELTSPLSCGMVIADGDEARLMRDFEAAEKAGLPITVHVAQPWNNALAELLNGDSAVTRVHLDLAFADQIATIRAELPGVSVLLATLNNFMDLNSFIHDRPSVIGQFDGVAFAGNPQVHSFDDRSITETPMTLLDQVASADALVEGLVAVGPMTLEPTGRRGQAADARLREPIFAAWTLGVIIAATQAGAYSLVIGETTGERGFWQEGKLSLAGELLRAVAEAGISARIPVSTNPLEILGIEIGEQRFTAYLGENPRVEVSDNITS
jgi:hypothetical protein